MSDNNMSTNEFLTTVNKQRLAGGWYYFSDTVNGHAVSIKGYGTYLQIFLVDGYRVPAPMEMKVSEYKDTLANAVSREQ